MRSKSTNILQAIVLLTGILYAAVGIIFYVSPMFFGSLFGVNVTEDWMNQVKLDNFMLPLYCIAQGFAALVFATGISMVLPLFDPLKYRGLIYYTGIIFPLMCGGMLLRNGISYRHSMVIMLGAVFTLVLGITLFGLIITRKQAQSGIE